MLGAKAFGFQLFYPLKIDKETVTPSIRGGRNFDPPIGGVVESMTSSHFLVTPLPHGSN